MIRRVLAAAFAATLVLPAAGSAQLMPMLDDPTWTPRFRISPFIGYLTSVSRADEWTTSNGTQFRDEFVEMEIGGGAAVGLALAMPLHGSWGVAAGAGYASRAGFIFAPQSGEALQQEGQNRVFFGRLGAHLVLQESESDLTLRRLNASAFAGAVMMHERPTNAGVADLIGNATHFGINLGLEGELPFASDRFSVQVALEDNIMWWDETQMGNLAFAHFDDGAGTFTRAQTTASTDFSHAWLLRAGISIRLR
ncbi:MAG TPA: hypothetical protein VMN60_07430 [Longimicrobiales bacterium]|nr:hypothetical protein [Longimicrobiales bacterium]